LQDLKAQVGARPRSSVEAAAAVPADCPDVNTDRSMPPEKCLPVEEITITRARALASMSRTIPGSSCQNSGTIVFSSSPRLSWMWAMLSAKATVKQR